MPSKKYNKNERQNFCARWKASGQSIKDFCRDNKISRSTLYKWLNQVKHESTIISKAEIPINFLPIEVTSKSAGNKAVEILLPNGILLKIAVESIGSLIKELSL